MKTGKEQPDGMDFVVSIFGFDPKKQTKGKNPLRFHFADDYVWFTTLQQSVEFIQNTPKLFEYFQKTKVFQNMVDCFNSNKPFFQIAGVIIKKKQGDGGWMYFTQHEKELVIKGFKKEFSTDKITLQQEEKLQREEDSKKGTQVFINQ
jgi:hypothetical protein